MFSFSHLTNDETSFTTPSKTEFFINPPDTNEVIEKFDFSTWVQLVVRSLFTSVSIDDLYEGSNDAIPFMLTEVKKPSIGPLEETILPKEAEDTLSIYYQKYSRRKNKKKGKEKKYGLI